MDMVALVESGGGDGSGGGVGGVAVERSRSRPKSRLKSRTRTKRSRLVDALTCGDVWVGRLRMFMVAYFDLGIVSHGPIRCDSSLPHGMEFGNRAVG